MARRRRREGCSLRPLGCLALLFLCGLCTTSTFFGGRAAEDRGWIPEVDAPALPDVELPRIEVVFDEPMTTATPGPSPTPAPREEASDLHRRILETRVEVRGMPSDNDFPWVIEDGVTLYVRGRNTLVRAQIDLDGDGKLEERWRFEEGSSLERPLVTRTFWPDDEQRTQVETWQWGGEDWERVP